MDKQAKINRLMTALENIRDQMKCVRNNLSTNSLYLGCNLDLLNDKEYNDLKVKEMYIENKLSVLLG